MRKMIKKTNKKISVAIMVKSALLGVVGALLMQVSFRLPIFPGFLSLDISDLPALVGAITAGPLVGLLATLIKNLVDPLLFGTNTMGIGNMADFIMGAALVVPIGFIFRKRKNVVGYLIGGVTGIVMLVVTASIMNYFVLLPLYSRIFMPMERILEIANQVNANVTNIYGLILLAIVPFNLLKGSIVVVLGYGVYRALKPIFARMNSQI